MQNNRHIVMVWLLLAALGAALAPGAAAAESERPIVVVKDTISRILETLRDQTLAPEAARARVASIASERIDYRDMSQRILARHWAKADPEQQDRFVSMFRDVVVNLYWERIRKYAGEEVFYFTSSIDQEIYATVDTVIQSDTIEIPVTYRLRLSNAA